MFYHAEGLSAAGAHVGALFGIGANGWIDTTTLTVLKRYALYLPIPLIGCFPLVPAIRRFFAKRERIANWYAPLAGVTAVLLGVVSLLFFGYNRMEIPPKDGQDRVPTSGANGGEQNEFAIIHLGQSCRDGNQMADNRDESSCQCRRHAMVIKILFAFLNFFLIKQTEMP